MFLVLTRFLSLPFGMAAKIIKILRKGHKK
jgi:hypothetical protein